MRWTTFAVVAAVTLVCVWGITTQVPATAGIPTLEVPPNELSIDPGPEVAGLGKKIAGCWYSLDWPSPDPDNPSATVVWNIMEDGNIAGMSGVDNGGLAFGTLVFSITRGTWAKTGSHSIATTNLLLAFDTAQDNRHVLTINTLGEVEFSRDYQTMTVVQHNKAYLPSQDPFDPDEVPFAGPDLIGEFTARKVNLE